MPQPDPRSPNRKPNIETSKRFRKAHACLSVGLQGLIEGCVRDAVNRIRAEPQTFIRHYDRVAGLRGATVLELKVSGAHRLLAHWDDGCLKLLHVGDHNVVGGYTSEKFYLDRLQREVPNG